MARGTWGGVGDRHPYRVKISWASETNTYQTGFHLRSAGANVSDPQEVANEVADWVEDSFRTIIPTDSRILGIDVVDLVDFSGGSVSPANQFGTAIVSPTQQMPGALAVVVSMRGELRTRYGQGRMFWPVIAEENVNRNVLNSTAEAFFGGVITEMATRFIGNTLTGHNLINVHGVIPPKAATPTRPARPEVPPSWYDVQSLRLNSRVTFLRSRIGGRGS